MDRVAFVTHQGVKVLRVDLSAPATIDENLATIERAKALVGTHPARSLLILTNVSGAIFNTKAVAEMKRYSSFNTPFVKASAVIGISGLARIIYDGVVKAIGRSVPRFDTEAEALDWLIRQ